MCTRVRARVCTCVVCVVCVGVCLPDFVWEAACVYVCAVVHVCLICVCLCECTCVCMHMHVHGEGWLLESPDRDWEREGPLDEKPEEMLAPSGVAQSCADSDWALPRNMFPLLCCQDQPHCAPRSSAGCCWCRGGREVLPAVCPPRGAVKGGGISEDQGEAAPLPVY